MANCINELKSWPLRSGVIVISIVSWMLALGFIAYFFGLYLGDVKFYGDRHYYMTVYANKSDAIAPWNNLLKRLKTFSDKVCRGFIPHPTTTTSPVLRRRVIVSPYWAWSSPRSLELFTEMSRPDVRSGARTRERIASRTASRLPADASTMIMPRLPRYGFVWSTKGPTPPSFLLPELPALPFYPGLMPIFLNRTRYWNTKTRYDQYDGRKDSFGISAVFEEEEKGTTKSLRRKCLTIGENFLEELLDTVTQMQKEFVDMVQGRLHLVFLVLDLVMVLLNSMLCVSSFMLLIGGHTKNRLLVLPWICISGVCVYGNVIYGLLHIVVEHEGEFLMGVVTALHIIFVIVIIILHAVALAFVHRYMLNLFHRDRRRGRT